MERQTHCTMGLGNKNFKFFTLGILIFLGSGSFTFCQNLQPAPALELLESGWGAAATGMGGAYTAVARDLTAIYWNPAGLAQLPGLQVFGEYGITGDSDEDFAGEVLPNRFDSAQRFEISGNQFDFAGVSYAIQSGSTRIVPAFTWRRTTTAALERNLKETAGVVEFTTPDDFFQSEGIFQQTLKHAGEEYSIGIAASVNNRILIGGAINFQAGDPETSLTGQFHETLVEVGGGTIRSDLDVDQVLTEDFSGSSFRVGMLFFPNPAFSLGATLRFPYTHTSNLSLHRNGTITMNGSNANFDESATAESEIEIPFEWSAGAAVHLRGNVMAAGSVTFAEWENSQQIITNSTNVLLIPETALPYPVLRENAPAQNSLLQWRGGIEYHTGESGRGLTLRAGILWDGQPYTDAADGDRNYFKGYTFGAGFASGGLALDFGFIREKGDLTFTPFSQGTSEFSFRRFLISVNWASQ